jgi:GT2 family glycosyltransferase
MGANRRGDGAGAVTRGRLVTAPRVTAVVLNWCNAGDTVACVESLEGDGYGALSILVVDNGSPDGSGARLHARFAQHDFLDTGANLGYTGGNNRGIDRALASGAEYVLVINNDVVVEAGCIAELVRVAVTEPRAAAVAPKIVRFDDPTRLWFDGGWFDRTRAIGHHSGENLPDSPTASVAARRVTFVSGCCLLIPAAVLRDAGYFLEEFFAYLEDVEFGVRHVALGNVLMYAPAARVRHRVPPVGTAPTPFQIRLRDRNRRRLVALHYGVFDRVRFAIWFYPTRIVRALQYAVRGDTARARAVIEGAIGA